jgi:hypothetical protein
MRPDKDSRYERIFIANQFELRVVDGKIPIPDLRIEYMVVCLFAAGVGKCGLHDGEKT